jgi:hypothetical protein
MFDACDYEKMITLSNNKQLVNADITKKVPESSQKKWFAVLASPLPQRARSFVAIEPKGDVPHSPGGFPASRRAARWTMAASTTGFSNRSLLLRLGQAHRYALEDYVHRDLPVATNETWY